MANGYSKCAVCGQKMPTELDFNEKPFEIQLCCNECIGVAWREVTSALKEGRPSRLKRRISRKKHRILTPHERAAVIELYNGGMTKTAISQRFGCCVHTIYRLIAKHQEGKG